MRKAILIALAILLPAAAGKHFGPWSLGAAIRALDGSPLADRLLCLLALAATAAFLVSALGRFLVPGRATAATGIFSERGFTGLMIAVLVLWRLPFLRLGEFNVDESQDLAATITLIADPRYWLRADAVTHGPLVPFSLAIPAVFGIVPDFAASRFMGIVLITASLTMLYGILKTFTSAPVARLLVTPAVLSFALFTFKDYIVCNGEHLPIFLCTAAGYAGSQLRGNSPRRSRWMAFASGILLGCVPFAKLQGVPVAAAIGALIIGSIVARERRTDADPRAGSIAALFAGCFVPAIAVFCYLLYEGLLPYFLHSYILWNLRYSSGSYRLSDYKLRNPVMGAVWPSQFLRTNLFEPFLLASIAVGVSALAVLRRRNTLGAPRGTAGRIACAIVVTGAAYYAVCKPGHHFAHYLLLLFLPLPFLNAVVWERIIVRHYDADPRTFSPARLRQPAILLFVVLNIALPATAALLRRYEECLKTPPSTFQTVSVPGVPVAVREAGVGNAETLLVAGQILRYARRGDSLLVWGWRPSLHVLTGLPQGTRDSILPRVQNPLGEIDPYFLAVALHDFDANRPAVFVDEVGPVSWEYLDRKLSGHEAFPALDRRIREGYVYAGETGHMRIYVRKDRWVRDCGNPSPASH